MHAASGPTQGKQDRPPPLAALLPTSQGDGHLPAVLQIITLYWGSHASLKEVVNTLIHEYQHFLDIRTSQEDRAYDKELKQIGYQDNSYEKKAREAANRWEKACLQEMSSRGLLK